MDNDLYNIFGINQNATDLEIRKAYKKMILSCGDYDLINNPVGSKLFEKFTESYIILSNKIARNIYDNFGYDGLMQHNAYPNNLNFNEIYINEVNRSNSTMIKNDFSIERDNTIHITNCIPLKDVFTGKYVDEMITRSNICTVCNGCGSDDGILRTCKKCRGRKLLVNALNYDTTKPLVRQCEYCCNGVSNNNHKCKTCDGKRIVGEKFKIKYMIPIGVNENEIILLKNMGNVNLGNNTRDDVQIKIKYEEHEKFLREYDGINVGKLDLVTILNIPLVNAICGISKKIQLPCPDTIYHFTTNKIVKPNDIFTIENMGLPKRNNKNERGKLFIVVKISFPEILCEDSKTRIFETMNEFDNNDK